MAESIDWEWYQKKEFMNRLGSTMKPSEVNPEDYAVIYYAGGHGVIWDFPENKNFKILAAIFMKTAELFLRFVMELLVYFILHCNGDRLISGKKVTGFSNEEEKLAELDQFVPFLTEDELIKMEDFTKSRATVGSLCSRR